MIASAGNSKSVQFNSKVIVIVKELEFEVYWSFDLRNNVRMKLIPIG